MVENRQADKTAWQPLTFGGVAAFATASWKRLLVVQIIVALLVATSTVWFLQTAWFPTISLAAKKLPDKGEVRDGKLDWPGENPSLLGEGRFLAFVVDVNHSGQIHSTAHVQVELGQATIRFRSLFGMMEFPYPKNWIIGLNRGEAEPWWGAWKPPILWITFGGVALALPIMWSALATLFAGAVWLIAFYANRRLRIGGAWKMAGASLMPGAVVMIASIFAYGFGVLDLLQFIFAGVVHFVVDMVFLIASPFFLPRLEVVQKNPFTPKKGE
jgi:hypothetical protein